MKQFSICWKSILLLFIANFCFGQEEIGIGEWKAYVPFNISYAVAQSEQYVYSAAERGILKVSKADLEVERITKVQGLNDTEPRRLVFDNSTKTLVVAYLNGNIDLMVADQIVNIPNIFTNSNIIKSKAPNQARLDNSGHAYIAYEFGLVQLNLSSFTFGFSLFTDFEIYDFVQLQDKFYFSSDDGIYWADANPNVNHADLSVWTRFDTGWPLAYSSLSIVAVDDKLYCDVNGSLNEIINERPVLVMEAKDEYSIRQLSSLNNKLAVAFMYTGEEFKIDEFFFLGQDKELLGSYLRATCSIVMLGAVEADNGIVYYADEGLGLNYIETLGSACTKITTIGPPNDDAYEVAFRGQEVLVAAGSLSDKGDPDVKNRQGIYSYKDGIWDQFNHRDGFFGDSIVTYTDIAVGPSQQVAIGTFLKGAIIANADWSEAEVISAGNSCLDKQALLNRVTVSDVTYDRQGNLWMSNFWAQIPLKMIDAGGTCHSFPISRNFGTTSLTEITIDERGYKWIATSDEQRAIIVFDEGDIDDDSDDRFVILSNSNSEIQSNLVRDIKTDLDGDIWVGTDRGVVVFECAAAVFDNGCGGRRPIVEVDGVPALLLENERIRAIAIDGANRKWFGTSNGIFVQSPNGEEEVLRFDERNSPLISNFIVDIAINPLTGEVFISTDKGLMSYRTDATDGGSIHAPESEVFAFPNPVRPGYEGPIAVKGLPRDARVKITDIQGKLVFEGEANGGEAIWNGKDYTGRKAASGVYLVFSTSQSAFEKPDALVSKILIVN